MPVTAVVAARTSLKHKGLVLERKKINTDIRNDVFSWLAANRYSFVPSESNCFMVDVKRPGKQFIEVMEGKKVYIGRVWPAWPTHVRVTVGTAPEMEALRRHLRKRWKLRRKRHRGRRRASRGGGWIARTRVSPERLLELKHGHSWQAGGAEVIHSR